MKKLEETIQRVATNTTGYTRKQANKEWFDEECARVNEKKNAARERAIQNNTRWAKNAYKIARTKERRLFRNKARQLDEEDSNGEKNNKLMKFFKPAREINCKKKDFVEPWSHE
jgi:hypothetical protein